MKIGNAFLFFLAILAFSPACSSESLEADTLGVSDNVMASRGEAVLTQAELDAALTRIPAGSLLSYVRNGERVDMLIQTLLSQRLLANEARKAGFDQQRLAQLRMKLAAEKELADYWLATVMEDMPEADYESLAREKYLLNPDDFRTQEMVDVSHILVSSESRDVEEARVLALSLKSQLDEDPAKFSEFVGEFSEDPSKAGNGGRFASVTRGQMVKPFEDVAFSMTEPGQLSEPVETAYGFHIIRLNRFTPARQKPFEEVSAELIAKERAEYERDYRARYVRSLLTDPIVVPDGAIDEMVKRYFGEDLSGADIYQTE
jgi:peptidyl-prolyl cis-trans isomerase C